MSGDVRHHALTTESERKAKDQITEQANNSERNGGRRYREPSESLSKTDSVESKVENEMLCEDASGENDQMESSQVWS